MRRKIPYRVCSCTPDGVVTHLEARLLRKMVNREIHPIMCAESCKQKFKRGMRIGDLCAEAGHFSWALKVWWLTASLIEDKDFDDWRYVYFDNNRVRLSDVISETECELLIRRCCDLYQKLGFPDDYWWTKEREHISSISFGTHYHFLYAEKYNSNYYPDLIELEWEEEMKKCRAEQETEALFREAMGDNLPPCSQNFADYYFTE